MKRSLAARGLLLGLLVVASVACGDDTETEATLTPTLDLVGMSYVLSEAVGVDVPPSSALQMDFDKVRLHVSGGCNTMNGGYEVVNAKLEVTELAMTAMACVDDALMAFDTAISQFLDASPSIVVAGDVMTLAHDTVTLTFREAAPVADSALEGTTWTVTGTVQGDGTSSLPTTPANLLLKDGTAELFAGCNSGSGSYSVDGDTITFGPMAMTKKLCGPAATALESTVTAVVQGAVTFDIEGTKLTLFQGTDGLTLADKG